MNVRNPNVQFDKPNKILFGLKLFGLSQTSDNRTKLVFTTEHLKSEQTKRDILVRISKTERFYNQTRTKSAKIQTFRFWTLTVEEYSDQQLEGWISSGYKSCLLSRIWGNSFFRFYKYPGSVTRRHFSRIQNHAFFAVAQKTSRWHWERSIH